MFPIEMNNKDCKRFITKDPPIYRDIKKGTENQRRPHQKSQQQHDLAALIQQHPPKALHRQQR